MKPAFLLAVLTLAFSVVMLPRSTEAAATFNLFIDDGFNRANTTVGSGTSSATGVGNGWLDYVGNIYSINGNKVTGGTSANPLRGLYYATSSESMFRNGKIVYTGTTGASHGALAVARFNPANGGSGYAAGLIFKNSIKFYRAINGVSTEITTFGGAPYFGVSQPSFPDNVIFELIVSDISATSTQLLVRVYDASNPSVLVGSALYIDTSPLPAGYAGINHNTTGAAADRVQIFMTDPQSDIEAGNITPNLFATTSPSYKTKVQLLSEQAYGGTYPYSYQWQRSLTSSEGFANIPGATTTFLSDSGLAPGTTYYYRMSVSDSSTSTKTTVSSVLPVTTVSDAGHVIGFIGDSITAGTGAAGSGAGFDLSIANGARTEYLSLQNAGYSVGLVNRGIAGTRTYNWTSTTTNFTAALAAFQSAGVDTVQVMLGTNEIQDYNAGNPVSTTTYRANMQNIVNAFLVPGTGITRVMLNFSPYWNNNASSTVVQGGNAYLVAYQAELRNIASTTPGVYVGDTTFYDTVRLNTALLSDNLHPGPTGHTLMGQAWMRSYVANFEKPQPSAGSLTTSSATVSWTGSVPTSALVYYGTSTIYGSTTAQSSSLSHSVSLSNLTPNTAYFYRVVTTDSAGNTATSSDMTFTTSAEASVPAVSSTPTRAPGSVSAVSSAPLSQAEIAKLFGLPSAAAPATPGDAGCTGGAFSTMTGRPCSMTSSANPSSPAVPSPVSFVRNLQAGMTGSDVKALQQFLNAKGFTVASTGAGSPGKETTSFGSATKAALARFQKANGIIPASGYFGPLTRAFLAK